MEGHQNTHVSVGAMAVNLLSFGDRFNRIKAVLFLMLMVGLVSGVPSSYEPDLMQDAFGDNMYIVSGAMSAAKGIICALYNSILMSMSDERGRKGALLLSMSLSVVPYAVFVATNNYWAYSITDLFLGMYDAALCMSMAVITDRIPRSCGMRTECFALLIGTMFIGLAIGPFSSYVMTQNQTFVFALCLQVGVVLFVVLGFPEDSAKVSELEEEERRDLIKPEASYHISAAKTPLSDAENQINNANETSTLICPYTGAKSTGTGGCPVMHSQIVMTAPIPSKSTIDVILSYVKSAITAMVRLFKVFISSPPLMILTVMIFFNYLSVQVLEAFMNLYLGNNLNFTPDQQTISICAVAGAGLICLFFVTGLMKRFLGLLMALRVALFANGLQVGLFAAVQTPLQSYLVPILGIFAQATYPCASAVAITLVSEENVGAALGIASASRMLAEAVAPLAFGAIFNATQNDNPPLSGIGFVVAAGCVGISFLLSFLLRRRGDTCEETIVTSESAADATV